MYSYEDRIRAVKLFIKLGRRTGATVRQLGYPTKNALKSWHLEYERRRDLPAGYVRARQKYSQEQKRLAVEHYITHGRCIAATLRALGYPGRGALAAWIEELHPQLKQRIVSKAGGVVPGVNYLERSCCLTNECYPRSGCHRTPLLLFHIL